MAKEIGYPIAVKAAGGGGGKGFRVAMSEDELEKALEGAAREGEKFFSDPTVYLERYLEDPRHVEVQVLADGHGTVVHLGERDCSVQRRHQKLIEETPAPGVDDGVPASGSARSPPMPQRRSDTAPRGRSRACWRSGEDGEPEYFFLEMNTRVQVEHTVTEMATGIDIVREQIRIAAGEPISFTQDEVELRGHSIECRINAEAAHKKFAPAPGRITTYSEPAGPGVRVDSGVEAGAEISPMYDPMVAKLIVWDSDREAATARMLRALDEYEIGGITTLIPFHKALLATKQWRNAETCRDLVEDAKWLKSLAPEEPAPAAAPRRRPTEKVERDYTVEVDSRRFTVKVIGPPPAGRRGRCGRELRGAARAAPRALRRRLRRRRRRRGARVTAPGNGPARERRAGPGGRGGRGRVRDRGDEDGERDHRARGRQGRGAERQRGRLGRGRRRDRRDQIAVFDANGCSPRLTSAG